MMEKNTVKNESVHVFNTGSKKTDILLQLKASMDNLSSRMSTFETSLGSKIERLENNYSDLNGKIEDLYSKRD
jgi:hypothetical protein